MMFYPFGRIVVFLGKPMRVLSDATGEDLEEECQKVENAMVRLEKEADRYFDQK